MSLDPNVASAQDTSDKESLHEHAQPLDRFSDNRSRGGDLGGLDDSSFDGTVNLFVISVDCK